MSPAESSELCPWCTLPITVPSDRWANDDGGWSVPCNSLLTRNQARVGTTDKAAMQRTKRPVPRKTPLTNLRDHPKLHWPPGVEPNPPWAGPSAEVPDPSHVVLTKVDVAEADKRAPRHIILTGTFHGNIYRTTLTTDDGALLNNLGKLLQKCVGEPIYQVGSLQVDRSIRPPHRG